nr:retrovirus-related Pol polyprotein from transposon TNT 1-94 [Tanacetum cinerariifolium]
MMTRKRKIKLKQVLNSNMVFMAQMEKVLSDSKESSSSKEETIAEVSYYTSESESKSEYETSESYDNSTNYGLFVNNDDDQEIFYDSSEIFSKNHISSQMDHDESAVDHNNSEETANLINQLIKEKQIADQEILFNKMIRQLVELDENVRMLKNTVLEKDLKISELDKCVRNKYLEIEKCLERLNEYENKLHKIGQTNQTIHMIMPSRDKMYNGRKGIDLDTLSSFRRPKQSGVIWKKKRSSNTSNVVLSSDSHSKLNKDVKRYSHKDLLSCNNSHRVDTRSAYNCNDSMNVSCISRSYASYDVNDLFVFDDVSIRKSQVSKMPFRKKPRDSLNVHSKSNSNNSLPRTVFRCYLLNNYDDVGKFKAKGDIRVFVGYLKESATFRIYNRRTRKIHEAMNVNFDEILEMASKQFSLEPGLSNLNKMGKSSTSTITKSLTTNVETSNNKIPSHEGEFFHEVSESFQEESSSSLLNDDVQQSLEEVMIPLTNTQSISNIMVPNVNEASSSHNVFNERLEDAYFDASKTIIKTKWIVKNKEDESSLVIQNKERLVVVGYSQLEGIDYDETFALVARIEAIRFFLEYSAHKDFMVFQIQRFSMDFLKRKYMLVNLQVLSAKQYLDHVYALDKALYGLKQAPRAWYDVLSKFLIDIGFQKVPTPMVEQAKLKLDLVGKPVDHNDYRSMIKSLMYLSRPDIMFETCMCARY